MGKTSKNWRLRGEAANPSSFLKSGTTCQHILLRHKAVKPVPKKSGRNQFPLVTNRTQSALEDERHQARKHAHEKQLNLEYG